MIEIIVAILIFIVLIALVCDRVKLSSKLDNLNSEVNAEKNFTEMRLRFIRLDIEVLEEFKRALNRDYLMDWSFMNFDKNFLKLEKLIEHLDLEYKEDVILPPHFVKTGKKK